MKTNDKNSKHTAKSSEQQKDTSPAKELKTDFPISEKDEVKKAERRTNKAAKKST